MDMGDMDIQMSTVRMRDIGVKTDAFRRKNGW